MNFSGLLGFFSKLLKLNSSEPQDAAKTQRAARVRLQQLHEIDFVLSEPSTPMTLVIENLSTSGFGFSISPPGAIPLQTEHLAGQLQLREQTFPVHAKIVWNKGSHIGVALTDPSTQLIQGIKRYFETEFAATRLNPVRSELLNKSNEGTPHWFQGNDDCELYYLSSGNEVLNFSITVFNRYIEGGSKIPLFIGEVQNSDQRSGPAAKSTELLQKTSAPKEETLTQARRLISGISALELAHKNALLAFLAA